MPWKPIVVGVDASPEAADAAVFAVAVADRAETSCHLVHATPGSGHAPRRDSYPYTRRYEQASVQVTAALGNRVPAAVLKSLAVHRGKPAAVRNAATASFRTAAGFPRWTARLLSTAAGTRFPSAAVTCTLACSYRRVYG